MSSSLPPYMVSLALAGVGMVMLAFANTGERRKITKKGLNITGSILVVGGVLGGLMSYPFFVTIGGVENQFGGPPALPSFT